MYDAEYTRKFYNAYGDREWQRLEATPYGRLQAIIHEDMLKRYVRPGDKLLDAGSGPGRFSIAAAKAGANITMLDISDEQLEIARGKISAAGLNDSIENFIRADICNLSMFSEDEYDVVVCFGGALSYVCENRQKAAKELIRVARPGGAILVSAMSKHGPIINVVQMNDITTLKDPDKPTHNGPSLWSVVQTGDLGGFPSRAAGMPHAAMHLYTARELAGLFSKCMILEITGSNVTMREYSPTNNELAANPEVWKTVVEMERRLNHEPGLIDTGSHIIIAAAKEP